MPATFLPPSMNPARFTPPKQVELPEGVSQIPLIAPTDPGYKQVQEIWTARVRVFDLSKEEDIKEYEQVWQNVCDGLAKISDNQVHFVEKKGTYIALLRWAALSYKLPAG